MSDSKEIQTFPSPLRFTPIDLCIILSNQIISTHPPPEREKREQLTH